MVRLANITVVATIAAAAIIGVAIGLGGYTFVYARGGSYMTDDPEACVNCHVMRPQFDAWRKSSHHAVAVCNDCHAPPSGLAKYVVKAKNGWHHSKAFTTGDFHEPIRITAGNREVTEAQCRRCHEGTVAMMTSGHADRDIQCTRCHDQVGHRTAE